MGELKNWRKLICFQSLGKRILNAFVWEFGLSFFFFLAYRVELLWLFPGGIAGVAAAILLIWSVSQVLHLLRYCWKIHSPLRYLCTNGIVWLLLLVVSVSAMSWGSTEVRYSFFFPFQLVFLLGKADRVTSAVLVSLFMGLVFLAVPFFVPGNTHRTYYGRLAHEIRSRLKGSRYYHRRRRRSEPVQLGELVSIDEVTVAEEKDPPAEK